MKTTKIAATLTLLTLAAAWLPLPSRATAGGIIITEVMANPLDENKEEFIELYNAGLSAINLAQWSFTDGDAIDELSVWNEGALGNIVDVDALTGTLNLAAGQYAAILDSNYAEGTQPYNFGPNTLVMTVTNSTLGNGLSPDSDAITLFDQFGEVIDTYGTPREMSDPLERDDDGQDAIPLDPGNGISVEKINYNIGDVESNWAANADNTGTPGAANNPFVNEAPQITAAAFEPESVILGSGTATTLSATVTDANGPADIASVKAGFSALGEATVTLTKENDTEYSFTFTPDADLTAQSYAITLTALDQGGLSDTATTTLNLTIPTYSDLLVINELLPNPSASEAESEFIELKNTGTANIELSGWRLEDESGNSYTLSARELSADEIFAIYRSDSDISLNNTAETVKLFQPDGNLLQTVSYSEGAADDASYARQTDGNFVWTTTSTPHAENVFTTAANETDDENTAADTDDDSAAQTNDDSHRSTPNPNNNSSAESTAQCLSISEIKKLNVDDAICTEGTVTVSPGVFSDNYFYIQDEEAGIQVYSTSLDWGELNQGDVIQVRGKLGESYNEQKIKATQVQKNAAGELPATTASATDLANDDLTGMLVSASGTITRQSGATVYFDDGSGELKMYIYEGAKIVKPAWKKGDTISVRGIVNRTSSGKRLLPRQQSDLDFQGTGSVLGESTSTSGLPVSGFTFWWQIVALVAGGSALGYGTMRRVRLFQKVRHAFKRITTAGVQILRQ